MFDRAHVPLKVTAVNHARLERDEKEIPLVVVSLELSPLSPELAAELSPFMKGTLFTKADAAVNPQLTGATFNICDREQTLVFRMAADQEAESFRADNVTIGPCKVSRGKKNPHWTMSFTATFEPMGEHHLAQIVDSYTKFRYVTFGDATPNLLTETQRADREAAAGEAEEDDEAQEPARQTRRRRATPPTH
jgi:hypothetical protein